MYFCLQLIQNPWGNWFTLRSLETNIRSRTRTTDLWLVSTHFHYVCWWYVCCCPYLVSRFTAPPFDITGWTPPSKNRRACAATGRNRHGTPASVPYLAASTEAAPATPAAPRRASARGVAWDGEWAQSRAVIWVGDKSSKREGEKGAATPSISRTSVLVFLSR